MGVSTYSRIAGVARLLTLVGLCALLWQCGGTNKRKVNLCQSSSECAGECISGRCATLCSTLTCGVGLQCVLFDDESAPGCVDTGNETPGDATLFDATAETETPEVSPPDANDTAVSESTVPHLTVGCGTVGAGEEGKAYSGKLAIDSSAAVQVVAQSKPAGLAVNNAGEFSGTPNSPGTYQTKIIVQNGQGLKGEIVCPITITAKPIVISCGTLPVGIKDLPYPAHAGFKALTQFYRGTPTYTITGLPAGLTFEAAEGKISGTPTEVVSEQSITVEVVDGIGTSASVSCPLTVKPPLAWVAPIPGGKTLSTNGCYYTIAPGETIDLSQWISGGHDYGKGTTYTFNTTLGGSTPPGLTVFSGKLTMPAAPTRFGIWGFHVVIQRGPETLSTAFAATYMPLASRVLVRDDKGVVLSEPPQLSVGEGFSLSVDLDKGTPTERPRYECVEQTPNNWECNAWYALHFEYSWDAIFGPRGDCQGQCGANQVCYFDKTKPQSPGTCVDTKPGQCGGCTHPDAVCIDPPNDGVSGNECRLTNFVVGTVDAPPAAVGGNPNSYPFSVSQTMSLDGGWIIPASLPQLKGQCIWFRVDWSICVSDDKICLANVVTDATFRVTSTLSIRVPQ